MFLLCHVCMCLKVQYFKVFNSLFHIISCEVHLKIQFWSNRKPINVFPGGALLYAKMKLAWKVKPSLGAN